MTRSRILFAACGIAACDPAATTTRQSVCTPSSVATSYRYDSHERLERRWTNLGDGSAAAPDGAFTYAYATAEAPASIESRTLLDPTTSRRDAVLLHADGSALATLAEIPEGWRVDLLALRDRSLGETSSAVRDPIAIASSAAIRHVDLLAGATTLTRRRDAGLGPMLSLAETIQEAVDRNVAATTALDGGAVVATSVENGSASSATATDERGMVLSRRDAAGATTSFEYDAAHRLVAVTLPDGARHHAAFDDYGEQRTVQRDGLATIEIDPDPSAGYAIAKRYRDKTGQLVRTIAWTRDAIGRVVTETRTDANGDARVFAFDYDGAIPGEPVIAGQRGRLSRVRGAGFERRLRYAADGVLLEDETTLTAWRSITRQIAVREDRSVAGETWIVRDPAGTELQRIEIAHKIDAFGRPSALGVGGVDVLAFTYDGEGRLAAAEGAAGDHYAFAYDAVTQRITGYAKTGGAWQAGASWHFDANGRVDREELAGASRSYTYDARGFLTGFADPDRAGTFSYDIAGRPGTPATVDDAAGRVTQSGDLHVAYGPSGQIESATRGARVWQYRYDERDQRIMKLEDGVPVAGFVGDAYITGDHIVVPVRVAGQLLGLLDNGSFQPVAADPRGTVIAENGIGNLASPYGERAATPSLSPKLDYVEQRRDPDLGTIRMGVRDYDPALARFWTPDPLFLEDIDVCANSPAECNLYSYAKNDPVGNVDATGTCAAPALKPGQIGICVEAFIAAQGIGPLHIGHGDDRGFAPNDPTKTSKIMEQITIDRTTGDLVNDTTIARSVVGLPNYKGFAARLQKYGAIPGPPQVSMQGHGGSIVDDYVHHADGTYTFGVRGHAVNGFSWLRGAPKGTIDYRFHFRVDADGNVGVVNGGHKAFPSYGVYAYQLAPDGSVVTTTLHESSEHELRDLQYPFDGRIDEVTSEPGIHIFELK